MTKTQEKAFAFSKKDRIPREKPDEEEDRIKMPPIKNTQEKAKTTTVQKKELAGSKSASQGSLKKKPALGKKKGK